MCVCPAVRYVMFFVIGMANTVIRIIIVMIVIIVIIVIIIIIWGDSKRDRR